MITINSGGKKLLVSAVLAGLLFAFHANSYGQSSWFDKGKSVFGSFTEQKTADQLTVGEIGGAFKDALRIGSENVVKKVGSLDGFNTDPAIHIPLPGELDTVKKMLGKVGMSSMLDDLELKMNRAAEAASPKARELFLQAISDMTFEDVNTIYSGPEDAATKYFQSKMSPALLEEMTPLISSSLSQVGAVQSYDAVMGQYKTLPFVPDVKADMTTHVANKAMDGIFYYLAKEEAAIRQNPVRQTTDLLKRVFGGK